MTEPASVGAAEVQAALRGDRAAADALVLHLSTPIQRRVAGVLWRRARAGGRAVTRQEVVDLTQDVFVLLFERDGHVLRSWSSERGASLGGFVGLVAERYAVSVQRSGRKSAYKEFLTMDDEIFEGVGSSLDPEKVVGDRQLLGKLLDRLREELSPQGHRLFVALYVEQRSPDDVARDEGLTPNAVYLWRSRLKKRVRSLAEELEGAPAAVMGGSA